MSSSTDVKDVPKSEEEEAMDTTPDETKPVEETWEDIPDEIKSLGADEINSRIRLIENDIKVWTFSFSCI
jgi:26S proteasome regulatory subunit T5